MLTDEQIFGFSGWQLSIGLAVALATIIVFMTLNQRVKHSVSPLSTVKTVAWLLLPIYLLIFGFILYSLFQIAAHFPAPGNYGTNTAYGTALRWHVLALVGLITALGGLISAPLALIRVFTTERVTVATEEGLVTDRINAAVAGLGAEKTVKSGDKEETKPNIEVRIGPILSLERLAQKNLDEHVMIMQILCAYIRQNAPASGASVFELPQFAPLPDDPTTEQRAAAEAHQLKMWKSWQHGEISTLAKKLPPPRADIAIAMNVIGRRNPAQLRIEARWGPNAAPNAEWVFATPAPEWPKSKGKPPSKASIDAYKNQLQAWERTLSAYAGYRPDLRETNLQNTDLSKHILCGIRFDEAQIQGANLSEAQMQGANLWQAQMQGADLGLAQMQGADLGLAQMQGADLRQAQMQGADLWL
ncbi:MAG: pentapeptide repeat-containing protein, partial [Rhodobacteraceae bacterium]|nr:pentapeptide repeat-containing protein [Paracoccaceae bacterium]